MTRAEPLNKDIYPEDIDEVLKIYSDFYVASQAIINDVTYKLSMCEVTNFENEDPVFPK